MAPSYVAYPRIRGCYLPLYNAHNFVVNPSCVGIQKVYAEVSD